MVERLVDEAARISGIDRAEIRRRNYIPRDKFPYQTPVALQYDIGDYHTTLDKVLKAGDYAGFEKRREEAKKRGRLRGLGIASYIEACGIAPSAVVGSLGARAGLYEVGGRARASDGIGHRLYRLAFPRPGTRDHLRPARLLYPRRVPRQRRHRPRRHGQDPLRHGHLRLALARGRRQRHVQRHAEGHRQGQEDRGPSPRGGRGRHRVRQRRVPRRGHGQEEGARRGLACGLCAAQLPGRPRARARGAGLL